MYDQEHVNDLNKSKKYFWLVAICWLAAGVALFSVQDYALAGGKDLAELSTGLKNQINAISQVLVIIAYVAGIGFALAGIMQFKAHKDNPTSVPLSKPIVFLVVGALLLFLPTVISSAGQTIFGGGQQSGKTGTLQD